MRVTKLIREYVEKTVNAKVPYGEPTQTYKQHQQALADLCGQLEEKVDTYAQDLLAGVGNLPEGFTITRTQYHIFNSSTYNSPLYNADRAHQYEVRKKRQEAIDSILLSLELGATKADLERLIAEAISE